MHGPPLVVLAPGFPFVDKGAGAVGVRGGAVGVSGSGSAALLKQAVIRASGDTVTAANACSGCGSCLQIKRRIEATGGSATSGFYFITVKRIDVAVSGGAKFEHLRVWCDMDTDGGGYTVYAVRGGTPTAKISDANTCQDYGLQLAVPRTAPHLRSLIKTFGKRFFKVLPAVYGLSNGNFSALAFNSAVPKVARNWKAVDGGKWFVRAGPLPWS